MDGGRNPRKYGEQRFRGLQFSGGVLAPSQNCMVSSWWPQIDMPTIAAMGLPCSGRCRCSPLFGGFTYTADNSVPLLSSDHRRRCRVTPCRSRARGGAGGSRSSVPALSGCGLVSRPPPRTARRRACRASDRRGDPSLRGGPVRCDSSPTARLDSMYSTVRRAQTMVRRRRSGRARPSAF